MKGKRLGLFAKLLCFAMIIGFVLLMSGSGLSQEKVNSFNWSLIISAKAWSYIHHWEPIAREIEELSKGRVKINMFPSGSLVKPTDSYEAAISGATDMAWGVHMYTPGRFPLTSVMLLPGMIATETSGLAASWDLWQKVPEIREEHNEVKLLFLGWSPPYELHTAKRPVRTLEDLKGMRMQCTGSMAPSLKQLGAVPIIFPSEETYQALQKGIVEGALITLPVMLGYKVQEVTKYHLLNAPLPGSTQFVVMNLKRWNSLTPDLQKIFEQVFEKHWREGGPENDKYHDELAGALKKAGHELIYLSAQERGRWAKALKPLTEQWVTDIEGKGLPGRKVLEIASELAEKTNTEYPGKVSK